MVIRLCKYMIVTIAGVLLLLIATLSYMWHSSKDYRVYGVPVINYHQVRDTSTSALTVTTEEFKEQMMYLHQAGYHTISLDELYDYMTNGTELPDKPIVITFDDGYADNYEHALPILEEYNMKATLFMISDAINTPGFVTTDQLQTMEHHSFYIEGHTEHHHILTDVSPSLWEGEIKGGKTSLSQVMGKHIQYLAYPGGFTNEGIQEVTKESGYKMAFTVHHGTVKPGENLYALPRIPIFHNDVTYISFLLRIHCLSFVQLGWDMRSWLVEHGYKDIANYIIVF